MEQKITPFLWFNDKAEEAMNFYCSLFKDSKVISITKYPDSFPDPNMKGKVLTGIFELAGQRYMCLDGGPMFKFTEAVSMYVDCEDQAEVDKLWNALTADGGKESQCGWLIDKFGLSWQIIPKQLSKFMTDPDKEKSGRAMQAMFKMKKLDIAALQKAFDGK